MVSLTFDTAWGNGQTEDILNILEQYEVKSTFFVTGEWAQEYPEMVKAMSGQGHDVCNYSDTHPHMPQVGKEQQLAEITGCNEKIKEITGLSPILFRAPYGDYDNSVVEAANDLGMYCIQWNIDSYDWQDPSPEKQALVPVEARLHHPSAQRRRGHGSNLARRDSGYPGRGISNCTGFPAAAVRFLPCGP